MRTGSRPGGGARRATAGCAFSRTFTPPIRAAGRAFSCAEIERRTAPTAEWSSLRVGCPSAPPVSDGFHCSAHYRCPGGVNCPLQSRSSVFVTTPLNKLQASTSAIAGTGSGFPYRLKGVFSSGLCHICALRCLGCRSFSVWPARRTPFALSLVTCYRDGLSVLLSGLKSCRSWVVRPGVLFDFK